MQKRAKKEMPKMKMTVVENTMKNSVLVTYLLIDRIA
jgi:hypothetical protein